MTKILFNQLTLIGLIIGFVIAMIAGCVAYIFSPETAWGIGWGFSLIVAFCWMVYSIGISEDYLGVKYSLWQLLASCVSTLIGGGLAAGLICLF